MAAHPPSNPSPSGSAFRRLRVWLWRIFLCGLVGTGIELFLLDHTEGFWQWLPLGLMGAVLVATVAVRLWDNLWADRFLNTTLVLLVVSGLLGTIQHYRGNLEFELEIFPTLEGWELFWRTMKGATPTLAPGAMILLGLLGLAARLSYSSQGKLTLGRQQGDLE